MKQPSPDFRSIDRLQDAVTQHWGLEVPAERWRYVRDRIWRLLEESRGESDWFHDLHWDERRIAPLAPIITVGETYFFRDTGLFQMLESEILPALLASARRAGRTLAVGSAGCSTGEEIYSVAILLRRLLSACEDRDLTMLGVDINREAVEKARLGRYGVWSFRETPQKWKRDWFAPVADGKFQLCEEIRRLVRFRVANLARADAFPFSPAAFDLLLCRNVLMYFHRDVAPQVIDRLAQALRPGGVLLLSPSEAHLGRHANLELKQVGSSWIFVKQPEPALPKTAALHEGENGPDATVWTGLPWIADAAAHEPGNDADAAVSAVHATGSTEDSVHPAREEFARHEEPSLQAAIRQAQEYADRGQLESAREWAERALRMAPVQSSTHVLLGMILHDQGDLEGARECFKKAAFLDPDAVLAHFHLGMIALRLNHLEEARSALRRARALLHTAPAAGLDKYQGNSARDLQRMVHIMMERIND